MNDVSLVQLCCEYAPDTVKKVQIQIEMVHVESLFWHPHAFEPELVISMEDHVLELSFPWVTVSAPEVIPDHIKGFYGSTDYIATHPDNVQAIASLYLSTINAGFFSVSPPTPRVFAGKCTVVIKSLSLSLFLT